MDAKLERLSVSVASKVQEAEELNQQGDDLEKQIETFRQNKTSPKKLSQQKLKLATLQGKVSASMQQATE